MTQLTLTMRQYSDDTKIICVMCAVHGVVCVLSVVCAVTFGFEFSLPLLFSACSVCDVYLKFILWEI